jgi:methionine synthase I (cobalamin-dependent)
MSSIHEAIKKKHTHLDGAMGTMLQRYNFSEEDFSGERFKDFPHSLKETTIYYHSHKHDKKQFMLLILRPELILLKPILQERLSEWPIT